MDLQIFIQGFLVAIGLIVAIGPQNAYVLRQGLLRSHVFAIALTCSLSDTLLFFLGILGMGALISDNLLLLRLVSWGGVLFLLAYGLLAARRAWRGNNALEISADGKSSGAAGGRAGHQQLRLRTAIATAMALTYLNPHVYLDTVVLFGGLLAPPDWDGKWQHLAGGSLASFTWFFGIAYGARLLTPLFRRSLTWQILDGLIALIMFWIAWRIGSYVINL